MVLMNTSLNVIAKSLGFGLSKGLHFLEIVLIEKTFGVNKHDWLLDFTDQFSVVTDREEPPIKDDPNLEPFISGECHEGCGASKRMSGHYWT